jgi:hypothetical protein
MKSDYWLKTKTTILGRILVNYFDMFNQLLILSIVALNILMLFSYSESHGDREDNPKLWDLSITETKILIYTLGAIATILCFLIFISILTIKIGNFKLKVELDSKRKIMQISKESGSVLEFETGKFRTKVKDFISVCLKIVTHFEILYFLLCFIFFILGFSNHPSFFAFHITFIIVESPQMKNLLKAIWEPKTAILATLILMFIIVYLFSIVAYRAFENYYVDNT